MQVRAAGGEWGVMPSCTVVVAVLDAARSSQDDVINSDINRLLQVSESQRALHFVSNDEVRVAGGIRLIGRHAKARVHLLFFSGSLLK